MEWKKGTQYHAVMVNHIKMHTRKHPVWLFGQTVYAASFSKNAREKKGTFTCEHEMNKIRARNKEYTRCKQKSKKTKFKSVRYETIMALKWAKRRCISEWKTAHARIQSEMVVPRYIANWLILCALNRAHSRHIQCNGWFSTLCNES